MSVAECLPSKAAATTSAAPDFPSFYSSASASTSTATAGAATATAAITTIIISPLRLALKYLMVSPRFEAAGPCR